MVRDSPTPPPAGLAVNEAHRHGSGPADLRQLLVHSEGPPVAHLLHYLPAGLRSFVLLLEFLGLPNPLAPMRQDIFSRGGLFSSGLRCQDRYGPWIGLCP